MANWTRLKKAINDSIKSNGRGEISGQLLNGVLNNIASGLGSDDLFAGVAVPSTNPGNPDGNVFYLASEPGIYSNMGNVSVGENELSIITNRSGSWEKEKVMNVSDIDANIGTDVTVGDGAYIGQGANIGAGAKVPEGFDAGALKTSVDNLSKTVSNKVDKVPGKGLSTNDYTDNDKDTVTSLGRNINVGAPIWIRFHNPAGGAMIIGTGISIGTGFKAEKDVTIGSGAVIGSSVVVGTETLIGVNCKLGNYTIIERSNDALSETARLSVGGVALTFGTNSRIGTGVSIGNKVSVGDESKIYGSVTIGTGARIEEESYIRYNVKIGENTTIANNVSIKNGVEIGQAARIGDLTDIGNNVTIVPGAYLGYNVAIGTDGHSDNVLIKNGVKLGTNAKVWNEYGYIHIGVKDSEPFGCMIGSDVTIGSNVTIPSDVSIIAQANQIAFRTSMGTVVLKYNA